MIFPRFIGYQETHTFLAGLMQWRNTSSTLDHWLLSMSWNKWLENTTLWEQYLALYNIVCHKTDKIATLLETLWQNVAFIRDLIGTMIVWNALIGQLTMAITQAQ
jgi:hypothetical protein